MIWIKWVDVSVDPLGNNGNPIKLWHYKKTMVSQYTELSHIIYLFSPIWRVTKVLLMYKNVPIEEEPWNHLLCY